MKTWRAEIQVMTEWLAPSHIRARNWTSTSWISFLPLKTSCLYLFTPAVTVQTDTRGLTDAPDWGRTLWQCPQEGRQKGISGLELQCARCSEKSSGWQLQRSHEVRKKKEKFILSRGEKGNSLDKYKLKTYLEAGYVSWTFPGANCCNGMLNKSFLNLAVPHERCLNNQVLMDKLSKVLGRNRLLFNWNWNTWWFFSI